MSFYDDLVMEAQARYQRHYASYAARGTPFTLADETSESRRLGFPEKIRRLAREIESADCVVVGGASGLSSAGGADFYYGDTPSFRRYFGKFAETYGIKGAFDGTMRHWEDRAAFWAYLATFLHTTLSAEVREPYRHLDALLAGKDFFVITTNQDTQFVKLYPEEKIAEIQGDHRFFQCSVCCTDDTWDAIEPVRAMTAAMGDGITIPEELIPRCPHCGREAFPWVRGYGNFLQGKKYEAEYEKASKYLLERLEKKVLFLELGVGRMTPMFIQEPFWQLTYSLPNARYIAVNDRYDFLPQAIESKGMVIVGDINEVLRAALSEASGWAPKEAAC